MIDRLPPLTALRAFDAAARHLSFAKAAEELNVTPAALSFQIKSLEDHLGTALFHRLNRSVNLTEAGKTLAPGAEEGFATLRAAWRATRRLADSSALTITAGPAITAKWLAPRMFKFAAAHPEIELRFSASLKLMDFDRDEVDVAIRFGKGSDEGLFSRTVLRDWVTPMMSPKLAERIRKPADLASATLLHMDDVTDISAEANWPVWFKAAGLGPPPRGGLRFSHPDHAIDAAATGAGVVLGRICLSERDLREGRLIAPFPIALTTGSHFRFVCPKGSEEKPQIKAFLAWVLEQAKDMDVLNEGRILVSAADVTA
ncbi:transcriptional regulator GcvA [Nioella aestuarii]|uniref:transcriptional regulator GcvA n=1 Tax=Nioella aestuarii TaxID=1662864 RepID=UPI003D7FD973